MPSSTRCAPPRRGATAARWSSGPANGVREALAAAADGLAVCGGGCMGFVHPGAGVRAIGYLERDPLLPGPVALVTHSGSVFSAMLRTHRRLDYSLAVSSGQELVTEASAYVDYALSLPETRVVGLVLETLRDAEGMRAALADGRRPRRAGRGAHRRHLHPRPGPRRRPLRGARRVGRRVGGAVRGVRRAPRRRPRRADRQPRAVRGRAPGARAVAAGSRPCTTPEPSGCWSPTSPSGSACRSRR